MGPVPAEIIAAAAGIVGKVVAKPASDAALRREAVIRALKRLRLDPKLPPRDFDSLYAYALIEYCYELPAPVLAFFRDPYVLEAFRRSFDGGNWSRLRREAAEALQRNAETGEFGHVGHGFEEHVDGFIATFQGLVDRSRAPHETRMENKLDMLAQVLRARDDEETHRQRIEPLRAEATPAERLRDDVRPWFDAVGYEVRRTWPAEDGSVAMLVHVPQRRPGRFETVVVLCVDGELAPHQLRILERLVDDHQADEGWGLAQLRISESARRRAAEAGDRLFCYTFDELIELEADFEPYITWVEAEVRRRGIDTRYVPLSCRKEEIDPATGEMLDTSVYDWRSGGLDSYVQGWLREPTREHLSLLGEFGMGKSWFALHLAGELARGWRDAKRKGVPRPRIPLVIPLRDYAKQTSVEALLSEFFFHQHAIGMRSFEVFRVLNRMGRLLLIFDGFDEMAARADRNVMVANFWELANAVEPGAKLLLSSRTEHFPHAREARDLLNAKLSTAASATPGQGPAFDIVELVPFDDEQVELMLGHVLDEAKVASVMEHRDVRDLMRRPVMSELVLDALPEIEQGAEVDLARIYLYAIRRKMDRDILAERTFTSRADKLYFLCEVAWEMISTERLTLNYREFPERLRACFGAAVATQKDLDFWEQDMRNQGMLVRNSEGDYGPAHKSLLEFLVAFKFAAELGVLSGDFLEMFPAEAEAEAREAKERTWSEYFSARGRDGRLPALSRFSPESVDRLRNSFGAGPLGTEVFGFLTAMTDGGQEVWTLLTDIIRETANGTPEAGYVGGNCANLVVAAGGDFDGAMLARTDLSGFTPAGFNLTASMKGADLRSANLLESNLPDVVLTGADLRGAALEGEALMLMDRVVTQLIAHPGGAITARAGWEVFHWPDGDIESVPLRHDLPDMGDSWEWGRSCRILSWGRNDWAYANDAVAAVVDSVTGQPRLDLPASSLVSLVWHGTTAVLVHREGDAHAQVVDPVSKETLAELTVPGDPENAGFGVHQDGISAWSLKGDLFRVHLCRTGTAAWESVYRTRLSSGRRTVCSDARGVLVDDHEDGRGVAVDLRSGRVLELAMDDIELSGNLFEVAVSGDTGRVFLVGDPGVTIWAAPGVAPVKPLQVTSALGVAGVHVTDDGERLLTGSHAGEVMVRDPATGAALSRVSLNPNFQGARFSRDCGLEPHVLDAIELAGGIVTG
ncbi:NACHT domain-containing protein [Streptomyces sp. NBC_01142]|uniref:NACHT domain-containing protein n=1 Tax=Streptomyces sp. NBC_01142 TaxID=2975865 RepID=UPI0022581058|nr:NACHT domain-containing protein [Streptomyces sp. NBC_01142]MCX4820413.1 NACHT domain-containing protein [Streptomyces sp. NBC_01142]